MGAWLLVCVSGRCTKLPQSVLSLSAGAAECSTRCTRLSGTWPYCLDTSPLPLSECSMTHSSDSSCHRVTHSSGAGSHFQHNMSLQELVVDLLPSPQRCLDLIHELLPQLASEAYQAFIAQVSHKHIGCRHAVKYQAVAHF